MQHEKLGMLAIVLCEKHFPFKMQLADEIIQRIICYLKTNITLVPSLHIKTAIQN